MTTARATLAPALAIAAALGALAAGCAADDAPSCTVPDGVQPDWIGTIRCEADYALLWEEADEAVFARTRTVNWLIDREDDGRLYFINSRAFDLHYAFAAAYLDHGEPFTPVGTHAEFNLLNYRRADRRFALGKLVHYLDQGLVTVELSAGDTADADLVVASFEAVRDHIYDRAGLAYRPVSATQEAQLAELERRIPIVRTEDVFLGQTYQPLARGVGFGTLRFRRLTELGALPPAPTDVVVLDRVPNELSLVSGLITDELQTPLSHVNVLSKNRGTPNMALRGAFDDAALRAFDGQLVRLEVGPQDYALRAADPAEAQAYWDALRPAAPLVPAIGPPDEAVLDLAALDASDGDRVGVKAANLAELHRVRLPGDVAVPLPAAPLAVPFPFYARHLEASGAGAMVAALLEDAATLPADELERRLFAIRWTIFRAPMAAADRDAIAAALAARYAADERLRFRSSTNVEDLAEFSGAGLYTSAGAALADGPAAIEDAVKVVWASAWNHQAFVEREFYRVDHARVRMGVLVHPGFPDELANGVVLTINEFASNRPAYFINSQVGEVSVTNPTGQATAEQLLYYTWYEEPEYEIITRSSLLVGATGWPAGPSVLTGAELDELASYLEAIHLHFKQALGGGADFAMDVEYKLAPGRVLVVKQARPLRL